METQLKLYFIDQNYPDSNHVEFVTLKDFLRRPETKYYVNILFPNN